MDPGVPLGMTARVPRVPSAAKRYMSAGLSTFLLAGLLSFGIQRAAPADAAQLAEGWHSAWVAQSEYPTMKPGEIREFWIRFMNTGTEPWVRGVWGRQVNLALNGDNKEPFRLGMAIDWLWDDRLATTTAAVVRPGEVAEFRFKVRAPVRNATYYLNLRPVVDGLQWLEDEGVFWVIAVPPTAVGFEGIEDSGTPDVQLAVGPSHVVEEAAYELRVFDKSGKIVSTRRIASLFPGVTYTGDNALLYDADSGRFYLAGFSRDPSLLLVAASKSTDPTGDWMSWTFPSRLVLDYQHIGVNRDKFAVMITAKDSAAAAGAPSYQLHVFPKSDLLANVPSPRHDVLDTTTYLSPAQMLTASDDLYLTSYDRLWTLRGAPGAPALTSTSIPGAFRWTADASVEQPGSRPLWVGGEGRPVWANGILWDGKDTACRPASVAAIRHCAHLYAVSTVGTPALSQSFDIPAPLSNTFLAAVQVDPAGNMAAVLGRSSANEAVSLHFVARHADDPPNTVQGPFLLRAESGLFAFNCAACTDGRDRWGDYYAAALDPADLTTMWFAGEYAKQPTAPCGTCATTERSGTYIARIMFR